MSRKKVFPTHQRTPKSDREIRTGASPESTQTQRLAWALSKADLDGPWSINKIAPEKWWDDLLPKLKGFETMTWADVLKASGGRTHGNNSHSVPLSNVTDEAAYRLQELRQDDVDELFSLRLTGTERLMGIRDGRVLQILWYCPNHEAVKTAPR
jgi:hypothetical protein